MDLFGFLGGLIGDIGGDLQSIVTWATGNFNALWDNQGGILGVLGSFIGWVWGAVSSIVRFLQGFWDWLKNHLLNKIIDWICRHWDALKKWLKKIKKTIDLQKQNLQILWDTYVKPILDFIQAIRRALFIFRLLGFKWAAQLDAYLVKLENKIDLALLYAVQNLNILADWINYILDPFGILNPWVLLGGIFNSISAIWAMVLGLPSTQVSPTYRQQTQYLQNEDTSAGSASAIAAMAASHTLLPFDQQLAAAYDPLFANLGYNTVQF